MDLKEAGVATISATMVGYLVFLVGVSLCFESIFLGALVTAGSLFVIPYTRQPLAKKLNLQTPRVVLAVFVVFSLWAPSVVFDEYETGNYFGTEKDVSIEITADVAWTSEAESMTSFRRRSGPGNATYGIGDNSGRFEAFAEKRNGTEGTLTISIVVGEEVVATDTAGPGERRASVNHTISRFGR